MSFLVIKSRKCCYFVTYILYREEAATKVQWGMVISCDVSCEQIQLSGHKRSLTCMRLFVEIVNLPAKMCSKAKAKATRSTLNKKLCLAYT